MSVYKEIKEKYNLLLTDPDKLVTIKITCYNGTTVRMLTSVTGYNILQCGDLHVLGRADQLNGKTVRFDGVCKNPDGQKIKIKHKIYESGGEDEVKYIFPDDYTGSPEFDESDAEPHYRFYVTMRLL